MTERGGLPPVRVEVTAKFLSDAAERQRTYEARRKMWTAAFHPSEPRVKPEAVEAQLDAERATYRREEIAGFTVLVVQR